VPPRGLLRRWADRPVGAWLRAHPFAADWLLLTPFLVAGVIAVIDPIGQPDARPYDPLGVLLALGVIVPLAWRRRAPRLVLALNLGFTVPFLWLGYPDHGIGFSSLLALYTVAAHCARRPAAIALGWTLGVIVPLLTAGMLVEGEPLSLSMVFSNIAVFATAWLIGNAVRHRRVLVDDLRFRAEAAERKRDEEARRAVAEERARIAREMHDIVAHGLSVMIVQAGAARRVIDKRPEQAAEAMATIERTGREAMVEMRRLLGILRDGAAESDPSGPSAGPSPLPCATPPGACDVPLAPQPRLAGVGALIEQWNAAGLSVTYEVDGHVPELPAGVDVSAYRLIQEALTNVSKHAGTAHAAVRVRVDQEGLLIEVTDDGFGAAASAGSGTGHGLIGMQERVALFGGTVRAGPRPGGGFEVRATLPFDRPDVGAAAVPSEP
jgi:signal transduction histidine kinase